MNPIKESCCDALLEDPGLRSPLIEASRSRHGRTSRGINRARRRRRQFKLPSRFPLVPQLFYNQWCLHQKELIMMKHVVDTGPPHLDPDLVIRGRRLDAYAKELQQNITYNKDMIRRLNDVQRHGGMVDCWFRNRNRKCGLVMRKERLRAHELIRKRNKELYMRLMAVRSKNETAQELKKRWEETKVKLALGSTLPFILLKRIKIDRNVHDPAFDPPPNVRRQRVAMEFVMDEGAKLGKVQIELFNDKVPQTCELFMTLVKGDAEGHGYCGTHVYRIVPNMFCCAGDVAKDNGYGCYLPNGPYHPYLPENFDLRHTVPGVLSMIVSGDRAVGGQFNIIFKPLPQFDERHVVFGRIVAGPEKTLDKISALGKPLGAPWVSCKIRSCGYFTPHNIYKEGKHTTIKFPPKSLIRINQTP